MTPLPWKRDLSLGLSFSLSILVCQTECQICQVKLSNRMPDICQIGTPDRMPEYMSDIMPEYMSDRVSVKSSDSVLDDKVKCQNIYVR